MALSLAFPLGLAGCQDESKHIGTISGNKEQINLDPFANSNSEGEAAAKPSAAAKGGMVKDIKNKG